MSTVSQTTARSDNRFRWLLGAAFTAAILVMVVSPFGGLVMRAAQAGHPHAPDLALVARMPLAIKIHLGAALAALALGAVLMSVRKGRTFHRVAGWVWVSIVAVT